MSAYCFPLDLGRGLAVDPDGVARYYRHTEVEHRFGYYPVGENTLWHGGLHLHAPPGSVVSACADGEVVAARLGTEQGSCQGAFGSTSFVLCRHVALGATLNRIAGGASPAPFAADREVPYYSLVMHLGPASGDLARFPWLTRWQGREQIAPADLPAELRRGDVVRVSGARVRKGEPLWLSGAYGPPGQAVGVTHWELFSEENLTPSWPRAEDGDADFNVDAQAVLEVLRGANTDWWDLANLVLSADEVARFYGEQRDATRLRRFACRFTSEWAVDLQPAIRRLVGLRRFFIDEARLEAQWRPYIWWPLAVAAGVPLPATRLVWHNNPIALLEALEEATPAVEVEVRAVTRHGAVPLQGVRATLDGEDLGLSDEEGRFAGGARALRGSFLLTGAHASAEPGAGDERVEVEVAAADAAGGAASGRVRTLPAGGRAAEEAPLRAGADGRPGYTWSVGPGGAQRLCVDLPLENAVILAGHAFSIGAPVVTWHDPTGYDAYPGGHYDTRVALSWAKRDGLTLAEARRGVHQVVVHLDACDTSSMCFEVLEQRGLSCHFLLDLDGTLYQTLDLAERAWHAGWANEVAVGIEIAHRGLLCLDGREQGLRGRYRADAEGVYFRPLRKYAAGIRTPGYVARPARPEPITGEIQGSTCEQYDFTDAQYRTLIRLFRALEQAALPHLDLDVPRDAQGGMITTYLPDLPEPPPNAPPKAGETPTEEERAAWLQSIADYRAKLRDYPLIAHYHVSRNKRDPGPAFDWERVLAGIRAAAGAS